MIINYSSSFKSLDNYVVEFNGVQTTMCTQVRQSMVSTMQQIIRIYGAFLLKANKVRPIDLSQLPALPTNNVQLSKRTHASTRTIKRHIKRLLESGILVKKVWHGTNAPYELFINPKILWIKGIGHVEKPTITDKSRNKSSVDNQEVMINKGAKCPHTDTNKKTYKRNNILIGHDIVENEGLLSTCQDLGKTDKKTEKIEVRNSLSLMSLLFTDKKTKKVTKKVTKKTRRKDLVEEARRKDAWREDRVDAKKNAQKKQTGAQNFEVDPRAKEDKYLQNKAPRHAFLSQYATELWELARKSLYKGVWLNKRQLDVGSSLVYHWYESVKPHALEKAHEQYKKRICLVKNYINRDPDNRFVLLPDQFFDIENENGFRKSKAWYHKDQKHQNFLELQRIAVKEIEKFKKNELKDTGVGIPRLECYRKCEERISKLGVSSLLDRFYASCSPLLENEC